MAKSLVKGWFSTRGRPGDRTLADQVKGLDQLFANVHDKTVLDVGCAEGLISMELVRAGARLVHGVEIVPEHIYVARRESETSPELDQRTVFEIADANVWTPPHDFDIVIMLALLHKLKNPSAACERFARAAKEGVVLRLPPGPAPMVQDDRSGNKIFDIPLVLRDCGFELVSESNDGHFGEYVAYWSRRNG